MSANQIQYGGNHYKDAPGEQHWDMMWRLFREAWFVGNVSKYLFRYRKKNGLEDLRKARHYLDKLIELEDAEQERQLLGDDDRRNSAVFDRVRERATVERELENDTFDERDPTAAFKSRKTSEPNYP